MRGFVRGSAALTGEHQVLHVIVFGYPPNRYSSSVAYFKSLGEGGTTEAEPLAGVENAFKIGFEQPMEAIRAWRKGGETIQGEGGRWMVGTKWADRALAERLLGSVAHSPSGALVEEDERIGVREMPTIGTPLRVAPSASAFRSGGGVEGKSTPGGGRGVLGQVSDLIFGW